MFQPEEFFDLSLFVHKTIFSSGLPVWSAIANLNEYLKAQFASEMYPPNHTIHVSDHALLTEEDFGVIHIGKNVTIEEGVRIQGSAIIGDNVHIGHAALLREGCIIGDNVHIGHAVEVKHSIILPHARVAHLNYIGDSIVGNHVMVAGGVMCANMRLDQKKITLKHQDKVVDTDLRKFSSIIGDNSKIGVNAVLNPGTVLGKHCIVYPLTSVNGIHPEGSRIR